MLQMPGPERFHAMQHEAVQQVFQQRPRGQSDRQQEQSARPANGWPRCPSPNHRQRSDGRNQQRLGKPECRCGQPNTAHHEILTNFHTGSVRQRTWSHRSPGRTARAGGASHVRRARTVAHGRSDSATAEEGPRGLAGGGNAGWPSTRSARRVLRGQPRATCLPGLRTLMLGSVHHPTTGWRVGVLEPIAPLWRTYAWC